MRDGDRRPRSGQPESRLKAILFVDAVSSSLRMSLDEAATIAALRERISAIEEEVARHGGQVSGRGGDGLFCTFDSALEATLCALALQKQAVEEARRSDPLAFRFGLHIGDVVPSGEELLGNAINIAARLEHMAPPLGIFLSRAVYDLVQHRLDVDFEALGPQELKNIPHPVEVFALHAAGVLPQAGPGDESVGRQGAPGGQEARGGVPGGRETPPHDESSAGAPCIAVLPFRTLIGPEMERALGDGIVCDIIGRLTRFRRLDVIARASTFALREETLASRDIGRRLNAQYLVNGDIALKGSRLRIAVELVSSESERILWGQTYDESFESVFDIQDRLTEEIVTELMIEVDRAERHQLHARNPDSLDAYSLCLCGEEELLSLNKSACQSARDMFEEAMAHCQDYARAQAAIARTHGFMWKYRWVEDREHELELAREAAANAVNLDYNDPRAHSEMGWVSLYSRQHERALMAYGTALRLNPSDADIIADYADALKHDGSPEKAVPLFERAIRLNPLHADVYLKDLAHTHLVARDYEAAIATVGRMYRPGISRRVLAASYALAGRMEEAEREAALVLRDNPGFSPETWVTMVPDRNPDYTELFLEGMKRAGL